MSQRNTRLPFYLEPDDPPAKQELLRAALNLFVRQGYCETSIRDIADAAKFTNPALFKHFAGKDALAFYLFERCYARYALELQQVIVTAPDFDTKLHGLVVRFTELFDDDPNAFLYMNDNLRRFWRDVRPAMRKRSIIALLRELVSTGLAEKTISRDMDIDIMVAGLSGTLTQFARMHYFGEFKGKAQAWAGQLERTMRALVGG